MTWATKDIGLAAFIAAHGSRPTLSVDGESVWFVWDNPQRPQKARYYTGGSIPALAYYQELRRLRVAVRDALALVDAGVEGSFPSET